MVMLLIAGLTSCHLSNGPNFLRMSEAELARHNAAVPESERVNCISFNIEFNEEPKKVCGTLAEIQASLEPIAPGAKDESMPAFTMLRQSRSTNPPLTPSQQNSVVNNSGN